MVENLVGYAKSDLLTPLLLDDELNVGENNGAAKAWCAEVNAAIDSQIAAVPAERLAQVRLLLGALPSLQLRIGPAPVLRKDSCASQLRWFSRNTLGK